MYLSKVQLDWACTRNPYDWHRALWRLFPGLPNECRDFLFRVEQQRPGQGASVLMQSARRPDDSGPQARLVAEPKPIDLANLQQGMRLRFRLRANVIKTIRDAKEPDRPVRVPLIKESEQLNWLERKLGDVANVEATTVTPNPALFFRRQGRAGKLVTVTFDGTLQVRDPASLQKLMASGVGAAKSFGCGLLSVAWRAH